MRTIKILLHLLAIPICVFLYPFFLLGGVFSKKYLSSSLNLINQIYKSSMEIHNLATNTNTEIIEIKQPNYNNKGGTINGFN